MNDYCFRSERLVEKLTKFFKRLERLEVVINLVDFACPCTPKFVGNLQSEKEKQKYANELIATYFTWVEEEIKECSVLTETQKVNLVLETRSSLRNNIMDVLTGQDSDDHF